MRTSTHSTSPLDPRSFKACKHTNSSCKKNGFMIHTKKELILPLGYSFFSCIWRTWLWIQFKLLTVSSFWNREEARLLVVSQSVLQSRKWKWKLKKKVKKRKTFFVLYYFAPFELNTFNVKCKFFKLNLNLLHLLV